MMKSPGEDPAAARKGALDSIKKAEAGAQDVQQRLNVQSGPPGSAINPAIPQAAFEQSLTLFGKALHTKTDGTSPAHVDQEGNPRDWNGIPLTPGDVEAIKKHKSEEATITPEQMDSAVKAARDLFRETYGEQALQNAITPPKDDQPK